MNRKSETTLILDIGSGTQDVLIYQSVKELDNCFKLVLPSPTQNKAAEIKEITEEGSPLFLTGSIMGGGACVTAIKNHIKAGLEVFATELAAKTINDNLDRVQSLGIKLVKEQPEDTAVVVFEDIDTVKWRNFFDFWSLATPVRFAVAIQDHGESPEVSNRIFRMERWKAFMDSGGRLDDIVYRFPPDGLTRMKAVSESLNGDVILMDTGTAAICGALEDYEVGERQDEGVVIVNLGNSHTLIALVQKGRLLGLCEHHTSKINADKLNSLVERIIDGSLTNKEVFEDKGHGVAMAKGFSGLSFSPLVAVTGPKRNLFSSLKYYQAVPHGDMMLAGCFGLLRMGRKIGFIT